MTEIVAFEGERIRAEIKRLLEEKNSLMSHQRTLVAGPISAVGLRTDKRAFALP
jgi:hypothetical protein